MAPLRCNGTVAIILLKDVYADELWYTEPSGGKKCHYWMSEVSVKQRVHLTFLFVLMYKNDGEI